MEEVATLRKFSPPSISRMHSSLKLTDASQNFTYRISDPKKRATPPKLNDENDVYLRTMLTRVPQIDDFFHIISKLGEGTFSKVYRGRLKRQYIDTAVEDENKSAEEEAVQEYALKYIIPIVKPARVAQEIRFLRDLGGVCNVVPLRSCYFKNGHTVVVMPIVEHERFIDYFQKMDIDEVREYMRNILIAVERVHSHGIIHRDIKPSNFLYNRKTRQYGLVDFGLSQCERNLLRSNCRASFEALKDTRPSSASKARKTLDFNTVSVPNFDDQDNLKGEEKLLSLKRPLEESKVEHSLEPENKSKLINLMVNKRLRFIENRSPMPKLSSVFITPQTPTKSPGGTQRVYVPDSPVKEMPQTRTPLAENKNTTNIANSFVTPNKAPTVISASPAAGTFKLMTPVKLNPIEILGVQETPPRSVTRQFEFKSGPKPPVVKLFQESHSAVVTSKGQDHGMIAHKFMTPVVRGSQSTMAMKKVALKFDATGMRRQQTQPPLQPTLSNANRTGETSNDSNRTSGDSGASAGVSNTRPPPACLCAKTATICTICLRKPELNVPRAGTPGFRAPEILLRCANQSPKIDIWSVGVIFACILSGRYPFFRSLDDMTCLAEIITVLGSSRMKAAAKVLGKVLVTSQSTPAVDLKELCTKLRQSLAEARNEELVVDLKLSDAAIDLLTHLLDPNPYNRYSASEALRHPFFAA